MWFDYRLLCWGPIFEFRTTFSNRTPTHQWFVHIDIWRTGRISVFLVAPEASFSTLRWTNGVTTSSSPSSSRLSSPKSMSGRLTFQYEAELYSVSASTPESDFSAFFQSTSRDVLWGRRGEWSDKLSKLLIGSQPHPPRLVIEQLDKHFGHFVVSLVSETGPKVPNTTRHRLFALPRLHHLLVCQKRAKFAPQ